MKPKTVIRKYGDRRLYDSSGSRYVKLDDIATMIRDGIEVQVLDARTGKDITRVILTQIVVEDARGPETGLPLQLLRQLVMTSDKATHDFLTWYLNSTMDLYQKAQDTIHSGLSEAKAAVTSPLDYVRNLVAGQASPPAHDDDELDRLRHRVQELETLLAGRTAPAPRAPRRKKAKT
jgi:polyhydroxyalkanoate synthesis repressor PhaR